MSRGQSGVGSSLFAKRCSDTGDTPGLVTFLADVLYELGRVSLDHALAKWAIMLSLGILLVFFVALNEKKQIVTTMRGCFDEVRTWE